MSLDEKFAPFRTGFYETINNIFKKIAELFGYPENLGMPTVMDMSNEQYARTKFLESLPLHRTYWPPIQRPETWFEMIVGPAPMVDTIERYIYENTDEGFYNFYIENYRNIYFFPDWLSEFIQVKLHICLDIAVLEIAREFLFVAIMVYFQIVTLRIALAWFIYINPYTFPWCYVAAMVDWTEDLLLGIVPSILGVNITGSIFLGVLGVIGDSLNHLVFTMPFLPSEGVKSKLFINEEMRDVLVFHYLPILWYRHPIPNEIREFWYKERPDILNFMQKAYKNVDIQFLPDKIVEELNRQKLTTDLSLISDSFISQSNNFSDSISIDNLFQPDILFTSLTMINEHFHNFVLIHVDKYI